MTYVADPGFGDYSAGGLVCRHCGQLVGLDYGQRTPAGDGTWVHHSTRVAECEPVAVLRRFVAEESKNLRTALLALVDQWEALAKESDSDPQTARLAAAAEMSRPHAEKIQQIRALSEPIRALSELEELSGGDNG
jgi:signal transduction histidine kinase